MFDTNCNKCKCSVINGKKVRGPCTKKLCKDEKAKEKHSKKCRGKGTWIDHFEEKDCKWVECVKNEKGKFEKKTYLNFCEDILIKKIN